MGSSEYPQTSKPYATHTNCLKGFCTSYCPQWCFTISPPPPPSFVEFPDDSSGPSFPPLIIAIIGILASALLLVCYYTIISKYCGKRNLRNSENHDPGAEFDDNYGNSGSGHEPWHVSRQGLDESLIKSITICKYKKGVGSIEGTTCSVCLSEFLEDESIRLLPKCNHAFHVQCIDTWLKSHLTCPLCRSEIVFTNSSPVQLPPPVIETPPDNDSLPEISQADRNFTVDREENTDHGAVVTPKTPSRNFSMGNMEPRHTIIDVGLQPIRRSFSMGHCRRSQFFVAELLQNREHNGVQIEDCCLGNVGSPKCCVGDTSMVGCKTRLLHSVMRPAIMGRSFSSGRLSLSGHGRVKRADIPV